MKNKFNEDFFASVRETEVWKLLSEDRNFAWSETLIDRYQDKIDWKALSGNSNVQWTTSMLEKYKKQLDWKELSDSGSESLFSSENLRKFSSKWDWSELSSNYSVKWTMEKAEEFKDFIDWGKLIDRYRSNDLYTLEFFEKYKEYFPVSSLQNSRLWGDVMEAHKEKLIEEILGQ